MDELCECNVKFLHEAKSVWYLIMFCFTISALLSVIGREIE